MHSPTIPIFGLLLLLFIHGQASPAAAQSASELATPFSGWSVAEELRATAAPSSSVWPIELGASTRDTVSTLAERFVGGWIFGTLAMLGVGFAALAVDEDFFEGGGGILAPLTYVAATTAGIRLSLRPEEDLRLKRVLGGAALGALPLAAAVLVDDVGYFVLLTAPVTWIASPLLGGWAQGSGW